MAVRNTACYDSNDLFTVKELLSSGILGDSEAIAGYAGLHRVIKSVTVLTAPNPEKWLSEGLLLLTNGYPFRDRLQDCASLVETLAAQECAALCIHLERFVPELPREALARADSLALPILTIGGQPGWINIIEKVLSRLNRQNERLKGEIADIFFSRFPDKPLKAILAATTLINRVTDAKMLVLDRHKKPMLNTVASRTVKSYPFGYLIQPICSCREVLGYLAIQAPSGNIPLEPFAEVLQLVKNFTKSSLYLHKSRVETRAARSGLLENFLCNASQQLYPEHLGFSDQNQTVNVIATSQLYNKKNNVFSDLFAEELEHAINGFCFCLNDGMAAVTTEEDIAPKINALSELWRPYKTKPVFGVSSGGALDSLRMLVREAFFASTAPYMFSSVCGPVVFYDQLPSGSVLLDSPFALIDESFAKVLMQLSALKSEDKEMIRTLRYYLYADCSLKKASQALHLHPNSLKYRLQKINRFIKLSTFQDRAVTFFALKWMHTMYEREFEGACR